jgi:uracil-DNA glycosylase
MQFEYHALLDATINHLESLQSAGQSHVPVDKQVLAALTAPTPRPAPSPRSRSSSLTSKLPPTPTPQPPPAPVAPRPGTLPASAQTKESAMAELRERALICRLCPHLAATRKQVVFGVGDIHSPLMFVGEAPGADEDQLGEPFVGKAGQLLTRIIQTMGLDRNTVYIANILKCRPDTPAQKSGNRKPTPEEMKTCLPYLLAQIDIIQPKVLVALGATAMEGLLGRTTGISRLRGQWLRFRDIPLMPTYHPAYLLRNQSLAMKREVWEDMLQVLERLDLPISEKQRSFFLKA